MKKGKEDASKNFISAHDALTLYCRRLGNPVPFKYCRTVSDDLPCHLILGCWQDKFNVEEFVRAHYSEAEIEAFEGGRKPRLDLIFGVLEAAKKK